MDGIRTPRGLIRYASAASIAEKRGFRWTGRVIAYIVVLAALVLLLTFLLVQRAPLDVTVLRTPGMLFQEQPGERISNVYDLKVINKTFDSVPVGVRLLSPSGELQGVGDAMRVPSQGVAESKFLVILRQSDLRAMSTPLVLGIYADTTLVQQVSTSFLGPVRKSQ